MLRQRLVRLLAAVALLAPAAPVAAYPIVGNPALPPAIAFVDLEPGDSVIQGVASNIDAGAVRVVVWALADYWYPQPSAGDALAPIAADGTWSAWSRPWQNLVAVLVGADYQPDAISYVHPGLAPGVLAFAQFPQVRPDLPIQFSGYSWGAKLSAERIPFGPNYWGGGTSNIWVDGDGMHLAIANLGGNWVCPEVYLLEPHGYGAYTFALGSPVDDLDPYAVFRAFTFGAGGHELDFEFSPASAAPEGAQFVVRPTEAVIRYSLAGATSSTHRVEWYPDHVLFRSWRGLSTADADLVAAWDYTGGDVPPAGDATWLFNLWLAAGEAPARGVGQEVVVRSFSYEPYGAPPTFAASGQVTLPGVTDLSGTTVTFVRVAGSGALPAPVQTDAAGVWSATGFSQGATYTATPTRTGFTFTPTSRQFSDAAAGLDFAGLGATYGASGHVTLLGQTDYSGVTVMFARLSGTGPVPAAVSTSPTGAWSASGFVPGTVYLAMPNRSGWNFTPSSSQFSAAATTLDFVGQLSAYQASGQVLLAGQTDHSGVTLAFARLSGAGTIPEVVTTNAAGAWLVNGFQTGTVYVVTPDRPGWTFTPTWRRFSAASASLDFTGQQPAFAVSGVVTLPGQSDQSGTSITFTRVSGTGTLPAAVQTDAAGAWSATGFAAGTVYLATPSRPGWTFTPGSAQFSGAAATVNFAGQQVAYAVSGRVTLQGQSDHSGVTITFARVFGSGVTPAAVQTAADGAWSASGFEPGSVYLATPHRSGWSFAPGSVELSGAATNLDFAGQQPFYAAAGVVALAGQTDHSGVTVTFTRVSGTGTLPAAVVTSASGAWSATGFQSGTTYRATPTRPGWTFLPASADFGAAAANLNFSGQVPPYAVSGVVTLAGMADHSGTAVTFARLSGTGAVPAPVQTSATGAWSASGFETGSTYLATPYRAGWSFAPTSAEFRAAATDLNFAGREPAYAVSGVVTLTGQTNHAGVSIAFSRVSGTGAVPAAVQTGATGTWSATGFEGGTAYRATATRSGWTFVPPTVDFTAATTAANFVGQPPPFALSGRVTLIGLTDHSGVTIAFARVAGAGAVPAAVQTGAGGAWSASGFDAGTTYRVTPARPGWAFTPASRTASAAAADLEFTGNSAAVLLVRAVVGASRLASPAQIVVGRRVVIEVLLASRDDPRDSSAVTAFGLQVPPALGAVSSANAVRLTTVAGVTGSVVVSAEGLSEQFQITTLPGSLDHLVIAPQVASLAAGQQTDFDAGGVDSYGNQFALVGVNVAWHCVPSTLGTITAAGLFTAGSAGGEGYVVAVASQGLRFGDTDVSSTGSGKITVSGARPTGFVLHQNTPNPFNPETTIRFDLAVSRRVRLDVFDAAGRLVRVLTDQSLPAGSHAFRWDGTDSQGAMLGSGVYYVRLTGDGAAAAVRKALLVR